MVLSWRYRSRAARRQGTGDRTDRLEGGRHQDQVRNALTFGNQLAINQVSLPSSDVYQELVKPQVRMNHVIGVKVLDCFSGLYTEPPLRFAVQGWAALEKSVEVALISPCEEQPWTWKLGGFATVPGD